MRVILSRPRLRADVWYECGAAVYRLLALGVVSLCLLAAGCPLDREVRIEGATMGTTYHITMVAPVFKGTGHLKSRIDQRLAEINRSMSTFMADSEISRFNALASTDDTLRVSKDFLAVMQVAQRLHRLTRGAWDGTVNPLVNLWGFGAAGPQNRLPAAAEIKKVLAAVGFNRIEISPDGYLRKKTAAISLDLGAIAKGYAVDQVAALLRAERLKNYLVEIGGEVYASGIRKDGQPWNIGINLPRADAPSDSVYKIIPLQDKALATSGDYRNFFEAGQKRYAHVLDPRTGYPVASGVVSASIIADDCTQADGLATAIMVMGPEKGLALVNQLERVEGLIVVQQSDGTLHNYYSSGLHGEP